MKNPSTHEPKSEKSPVLIKDWGWEPEPPLSPADRAKMRFLQIQWEEAEARCHSAQTEIVLQIMEIFQQHIRNNAVKQSDLEASSRPVSPLPWMKRKKQ